MIKLIVFDLGEVVLTNDWNFKCPEKFRAYERYFGTTEKDMAGAWKLAYPKYSIGKKTENAFWNEFLKLSKAKIIDAKQAKVLWRRYQFEKEDMLNLLDRLHKRNRLAALTNIGKEWLVWKTKRFNLKKRFEFIVSSGYSGIKKPDKGIYKLLLKRSKVKPGECLFIDDVKGNINVARELGMQGMVFKNQKDLESKLKRFNIEF